MVVLKLLSFKLCLFMTLAFSIWMYAQGHASCKVYVHLDVAVKNERSVRACNSPVCTQCGCWSQNLGVSKKVLLRVSQRKEMFGSGMFRLCNEQCVLQVWKFRVLPSLARDPPEV